MIKFFRKNPYIYSIIAIALISLLFLYIKNTEMEKHSETELSEAISEAKGIQALTIGELLTEEKEPAKEENAYFYYQKALEEIKNKNRKNDIRLLELLRTGNSMQNYYICNPQEDFNRTVSGAYSRLLPLPQTEYKTEAKTEYTEARKVTKEISDYYQKRTDNYIECREYEKAYGDLADWLVFLQKSFTGNRRTNNYPYVTDTLTYIRELKVANETLESLQNKKPLYHERIAQEMENILQSYKDLAARTTDLEFILGMECINKDFSNPELMEKLRLQKYRRNKIKTEFIKQQLLIKQFIETGNQDFKNKMAAETETLDNIYKNFMTYSNYFYIDPINASKNLWEKSAGKMEKLKKAE